MDLRVFLSLDGSGFLRGVSIARAAVNRFGSDIKSQLAGAFTAGAITYGIKRVMDYADNIEESASRIGISTDALQEWSFAAEQAGVSAEKLQNFIERLNAAAADGKLESAWAALGVNPSQTPEALFTSVASKTQGKSPTEILKLLEPLGLSVKQIGPMVNVLSGDLSQAGETARKLGAVMDQATVQHLAHLNDQLSIVSQVLMANFAPSLLTAGKAALAAFKGIQGAAGWLGARTANWSAADVVSLLLPGGITRAPELIGKTIQGNEMGLDDAAAAEWNARMKELADMLERLAKYTAFVPSVIVPTGEEAAKKGGKPNSDSLVAVGNFLGSGRGNIDSIARETNSILREHTTLLRQIAYKPIGLDIGVP